MHDLQPAAPDLLDGRWRLLRVRTEREVAASAQEVWAVVSDARTWTEWHADYEEHRPLTDTAVGLGAQFHTKEWIVRSESEITRWESGRVVGLTVLRSKGWHWLLRSYYSEVAIEPLAGESERCRVSYGAAFTGTWQFWLLSAYSVGHSLFSIYVDARSSLKALERYVVAEREV